MNEKKNIKYLCCFLILSLFLSYNLVLAIEKTSVSSVQIIQHSLEYQTYTSSNNFYTKNSDLNVQYYYNKETFTTLTNPCTKCVIGTRIYSEGGDYSGRLDLKMGETSNFTSVTSSAGEWSIQQMRVDYSLLSTYHYGTWYINTTP